MPVAVLVLVPLVAATLIFVAVSRKPVRDKLPLPRRKREPRPVLPVPLPQPETVNVPDLPPAYGLREMCRTCFLRQKHSHRPCFAIDCHCHCSRVAGYRA